jgi:methylmalonyl-CoA/ethylmalonyl-CoA epimerase
MRTRSNESPLVDIEPFAPLPRTVVRSSVIGDPFERMLPETCAEAAFVAAAFASASTWAAGFDASPFGFAVSPSLLPPHPARSTAARARARTQARIVGASLSNTIAHVETPSSVHHVGLAVEDLDGALDTYERLFGARLEHRSRVEEQGVEAASIRVGESRLELLGALGEDTPVGRFLAKRGPGMHHVAYEVEDLGAALAHLSEAGAELIDETPRRGMFGLEVAFVHPDSVHGVLSEVVSVG